MNSLFTLPAIGNDPYSPLQLKEKDSCTDMGRRQRKKIVVGCIKACGRRWSKSMSLRYGDYALSGLTESLGKKSPDSSYMPGSIFTKNKENIWENHLAGVGFQNVGNALILTWETITFVTNVISFDDFLEK